MKRYDKMIIFDAQLLDMIKSYRVNRNVIPSVVAWQGQDDEDNRVRFIQHKVEARKDENTALAASFSPPEGDGRKQVLYEQMGYLRNLVDDLDNAKGGNGGIDAVVNQAKLKRVIQTIIINLWRLKSELFGGGHPSVDPTAYVATESGGVQLVEEQIAFLSYNLQQKKLSHDPTISFPDSPTTGMTEIHLIEGIIEGLNELKSIKYS